MELEYVIVGLALAGVAYVIYRHNVKKKNSGSGGGTRRDTHLK